MVGSPRTSNRYVKIIEALFQKNFTEGANEVHFNREEFSKMAEQLNITLPKNLGDIVYSFRYRTDLPESITKTAPEGKYWVIQPHGRGKYRFAQVSIPRIIPSSILSEIKIPDSTPGVIEKYSFDDEQSLLAKLRYNRLIDIFTGLTCYSLQSHLRTTVAGMGQVETDEIYIGVDKRGAHYIIPVQAKGGTDILGVVQIGQDIAMCKQKFPQLLCRPLASQFMEDDVIALFEFEITQDSVRVAEEKHYRLVHPDDLSLEELESYRKRAVDQ
jgi:hypothetical protein